MAQNYVLLERIELSDAAASVTFNNIPQTGYTDLKIVMSTRNDAGTSYNDGRMTFNGSSTGYSSKLLYGNGSGAGSASATYGYGYWVNTTTTPGYTANTFSNTEIYIPNYTSSNYKSVSSDTVSENNSTLAVAGLTANLWSNTAAITSITLSQDYGNYVAGSTFSLYGIAAVGTTPTIAPKADGGNVIATDGTYWYHAFLSNGTFTPQTNLTADVLVVAGGGAGAWGNGGGGGAGGLLAFTSQSLTSTGYTCAVGAGASRITTGVEQQEANGSNSQFGSLTAAIGGGGAATFSNLKGSSYNGKSGGSGGGAGGTDGGAVNTGGAGTTGQGYAGGNGSANTTINAGGGGGGAGAVGSNAVITVAGAGGTGTNSYSAWLTATALGVSGYIAGGGGGGSNGTAAAGGSGGGGAGGTGTVGTAGTVNTGGGGGGGGGANNGSNGGSGIIIIRYAV